MAHLPRTVFDMSGSISCSPVFPPGEVSEWLKERDWKSRVRVTVPRVRIPPSPFKAAGKACGFFLNGGGGI